MLLQALFPPPAPASLTQYSQGNSSQMLCVRFATKNKTFLHHIVTFVGGGHWTGFDMYHIVNLFTGVQGCVNNNWSLLGHFPGPARNCWRFHNLLGLLPEQVHPGWTPWLHVQNQVCDHAIMSRYPGILKCLDIIHTTDWTQVQQVQLSPGEHKAADDAETPSCCFLPLEKVEFKFFLDIGETLSLAFHLKRWHFLDSVFGPAGSKKCCWVASNPFPPVRFEHSSRLHKKITTRVDFPEIVDMSPYISHARCPMKLFYLRLILPL